jgi:ABC-type glutathione transport system ATPase component
MQPLGLGEFMSLLLEQVEKSYREPDGTPLPILDIENFQLGDAEQVALVGESGSGLGLSFRLSICSRHFRRWKTCCSA